jgi:hypothetical protein
LYCKVCLVLSNGFTSFFVFSCRDECFLLEVVVFGVSSSSSAAPGRRLSVFLLAKWGRGRGGCFREEDYRRQSAK